MLKNIAQRKIVPEVLGGVFCVGIGIRSVCPEIESIDRFRGGFICQENGSLGHTAALVQRSVIAHVIRVHADQLVQQPE